MAVPIGSGSLNAQSSITKRAGTSVMSIQLFLTYPWTWFLALPLNRLNTYKRQYWSLVNREASAINLTLMEVF